MNTRLKKTIERFPLYLQVTCAYDFLSEHGLAEKYYYYLLNRSSTVKTKDATQFELPFELKEKLC